MFATMKTLFVGASARAEENLRDQYSIELIDQKIREAQANLKAAKLGLAGLIQRSRNETRQIETLNARIEDLMGRAQTAMQEGREDLARQAAQAIADMENERSLREETRSRLEARELQLRQSVETSNRRIIDLRQGAVAARAVRGEQNLQKTLVRHIGGENPMDEADALITKVLGGDDPFEQGDILAEIDRGLDHADIGDRLADAGVGKHGRATASDVLSRLRGGKDTAS